MMSGTVAEAGQSNPDAAPPSADADPPSADAAPPSVGGPSPSVSDPVPNYITLSDSSLDSVCYLDYDTSEANQVSESVVVNDGEGVPSGDGE